MNNLARRLRRWGLRRAVDVLRPVCGHLGVIDQKLRHELFLQEFQPRSDDTFIVTYPRSGTTWVQMIIHQLRGNGDIEFAHLEDVIPFFDRVEHGVGGKAVEALMAPRFFKSHRHLDQLPRNCRYIYIARDVRDVAESYYRFTREVWKEPEGPSARQAFLARFLAGQVQYGSWRDHVRSALQHRDDPRVLFLSYEALQGDLEGGVRRIASFIGAPVSSAQMPRIVERCSLAYMKQLEHKFHPSPTDMKPSSFIRSGVVGGGLGAFTAAQAAMFGEELDGLKREFDRVARDVGHRSDEKKRGSSRSPVEAGF